MQFQTAHPTRKQFAVNSVPNFWAGYYSPLSWVPQMSASQNCPLTMALKVVLEVSANPILSLKLRSRRQRADNGVWVGKSGVEFPWQFLEAPKHLCRFFRRQVKPNPMAQQMQTKASSVACFIRIHLCDKGPKQTQLLRILIHAIACAT